MIESPITESMIETGLRSGAITVENDCGELVAHIGDGYIICGDVESDEIPDELSMTGKSSMCSAALPRTRIKIMGSQTS